MRSLQPARGTKDILPDECRRHNEVVNRAREVVGRYGFFEMATPIFEFSEVFKRTLGEASDIVNKEMYAFADRGGEELVLRPEGTAGIARAFISGGLAQSLPLKFFYHGPMFRYERPQKGRFRQFHQCGVELLGPDSSFSDIEVISSAQLFLEELGLKNTIRLEINSIGDSASREQYRKVLVEHLEQHSDKLSEDSKKRLVTNPLRILDSKNKEDQKLLDDAPVFSDFLNEESKQRFAEVTAGLDQLEINYVVNPKLVRGLDYYSHCVFEFKSEGLGAQDTVLSGGRYNTLIKTMGGSDTPGVGWAAGIERLLLLFTKEVTTPRPIAIIPMGPEADKAIIALSHRLRQAGLPIEVAYSGNLSKRMKKAHKANARATVILGDEELKLGEATVKDLDTGAQVKMKLSQLETQLETFL